MQRLEVLSKSDCKAIHEAALQVLERTGIKVLDQKQRNVLKENGCNVDEKSMVVKYPASLVNDCLKKCPPSFTITGRDKKKAKKISYDDSMGFANFGTAVKIGTLDDDGRYSVRSTTISDVGTAAKIVDSLSNFDMGVTPCSALDLMGTNKKKDVHEQYEVMLNFTKHSMSDWTPGNLHYAFEFEKAFFGGDEEEALKNPFYTIGAPSTSPLTFGHTFDTFVQEATKFHMPVNAMGMVLSGASGPVFTAGNLVVAIAESIATIVYVQCLNPGNPTWIGSSGTILDLKAGTAACGCPERALISAAYANMGNFYKIPSFIAGPETDSKTIDAQSGHEKTLTGILPLLSKASMCFGPGMLESGLTFSPEQLLIDDDAISMMRFAEAGISVNDLTLSVDDIAEVGPGGDFLALKITMDNIDGQSTPDIFSRTGIDEWIGAGRKDAAMVAHERAKDIVKNYEVDPIDKDVLKSLQAIVTKADKVQ